MNARDKKKIIQNPQKTTAHFSVHAVGNGFVYYIENSFEKNTYVFHTLEDLMGAIQTELENLEMEGRTYHK